LETPVRVRTGVFVETAELRKLPWLESDPFAASRLRMTRRGAGQDDIGDSMDTASVFLNKSRYFLGVEYRTKIRAAVESMPAEALWWRANEQSNSVGNLLMHLAGNIRQWIVGGVGGEPNARDRAGEFAARSGDNAAALLARLDAALDDVDGVLARLTDADLARACMIQARELTVLEAIYHVVEHFSMHLGQIILIAKLHTPDAVKFYEDAGGLARPVWQELKR
jgi:uncharacterized damage-inducible protein DinB